MATITDVHRAFIVEQLACFSTLDEIAAALKSTFGVEVPKPTILRYDPTTIQGSKELAPKWKEAFEKRRTAFLEDVSAIPIASRVYRLKRLQQLSESKNCAQNPVQLRETLKQAAMEMGEMFTQKKEAPMQGGGAAGDALVNSFSQALDKIYGEKKEAPGGGTDRGGADAGRPPAS